MVSQQGRSQIEATRQEAATAIARTLRQTPALSWEDVKAINRFAVWTVRTYSVPLSEADLSWAWQEAHNIN